MPGGDIRLSRRLKNWRPSAGRATADPRAGASEFTGHLSLLPPHPGGQNWSGSCGLALLWVLQKFSGERCAWASRSTWLDCSLGREQQPCPWGAGASPSSSHSSPAANTILSPHPTPCSSAWGEPHPPCCPPAPLAPCAQKQAPHSPDLEPHGQKGIFFFNLLQCVWTFRWFILQTVI